MLGAYRLRISLGFPWWFLGGLPLGLTIASELDSRRWERITLRAASFDVAMVGKVENIGCTVSKDHGCYLDRYISIYIRWFIGSEMVLWWFHDGFGTGYFLLW